MLSSFLFSLSKRISRSAQSPWLWLVATLVFCSTTGYAQSYTTGNAFVEADVPRDGSGLVTVYLDAAHQESILFAGQTSFLTVDINNKFYTNNTSRLNTTAQPAYPTKFLQGGTTKKIGDTIETVWQPEGANAFDIIQDVYPVLFTTVGSGQIVFRFRIRNHENVFVGAQAQYLMDIDLSQGNHNNDNAPVTTRFGYMFTAWNHFPNALNDIPPYFISTLQPLDSGNFPLLLSQGFFNDSLSPDPMGLVQPALIAYTDWREIATGWTWGAPNVGTVYNPIGDEALLVQWPQNGADPNTTVELGRCSYGSGGCQPICFGNLDAMLIHPQHIRWNGAYNPPHFPVDGIIWNTQGSSASGASGTQSITPTPPQVNPGPIQIVSPNPPPPVYSQTHNLMGSTVAGRQSSSITWEDTILVNPSALVNCSTDSSYDIAFSVSAGGVGPTACQNGTYICPIIVDCQNKDVLPPAHTPHKRFGALNHCNDTVSYSDSVYDNRQSDQGLQSITWFALPNNNTVQVSIGTFSPCTASVVPIAVTQKDTLVAPCVYFTFTDCAGNVSYDTICFSSCQPPGFRDTLPPRFRLLNQNEHNFGDPTNSACEFKCSQWVVTDSVMNGLQHDAGLKSITAVSSLNMTFFDQPVTIGMKVDTFTTCVIDSFKNGSIYIEATDDSGHSTFDTITYCTINDTTPPVVTVQTPINNSWLVNVSETKPWDRGIDSILLTGIENCWPVPDSSVIKIDSINDSTCSIHPLKPCSDSLFFTIQIINKFKGACFTVQAWDCPGNSAASQSDCITQLADRFCPTDSLIQINPVEIMVIFSDVHPGINYDAGIDSIWFTNIHNMSMMYHGGPIVPVPNFIKEPVIGTFPRIYPLLDTVYFFVTDTTVHDPLPAKVCWDAIDGSTVNNGIGNQLCSNGDCWSYTLALDTTPAIVTMNYVPCDSLIVNVIDKRTNDRGIYEVWLDTAHNVNLYPYDNKAGGIPSLAFGLPDSNRFKSVTGRLTAFDIYGAQSGIQSVRDQHTDVLDFGMYKQDLAMKGSGLDTSTKQFNVPVYFSPTDGIALSQKNLYQFEFRFHLTGSPLLSFLGTANAPNMPAGWNVASAGGPIYTITGTGPALKDVDITDTLVYLTFKATAKSTDVESAQIVIDTDQCGAAVIYNNGNDTVISGANYSATLPAPTGRLNGGNVIFLDSCATIVGNNPNPTILSIAPMLPNPTSNSGQVQYTVPNEAPVSLELYNPLGQKIKTLVADVQKQGTYQITLDASSIPAGTYFLRLESGGNVCSERVILTK